MTREEQLMQDMAAGRVYNDFDPWLNAQREDARALGAEYASLLASGDDEGARYCLQTLLAAVGEGVSVLPPFTCEFGFFVHLADGVFINQEAIFLDCAPVHLGRRVMVGPRVCFFTSDHALDPAARARGDITAKPITVEDDVWIGGNVTIMGGVTIGAGTVIGAGSVVTRSVPAGVVAAGNPCRVIKPILAGETPDEAP